MTYNNATVAAGAITNSLTYSHTVGTASGNLILIVVVGNRDVNANNITGVTYSGVAMTLAGSAQDLSGDGNQTYVFYLFNPATGAHNVVVSATNSERLTSVAISYYVTHKVGASGGATPGTVTNVSDTFTTQQVKSWLVGGASKRGNFTDPFTGITNGTQRGGGSSAAGTGVNRFWTMAGDFVASGTPSSQTMTFTSAQSANSTAFAIEIADMRTRMIV